MSLHTHEDVLLRGRTHSRDPSNSTSKTKWAGNSSRYRKFGTNELDTIISGHLTQEQLAAYQQYFRIEEISDVLRVSAQQRRGILSILPSGNLEQNPNFHRDPSPPPKYDNQGNRTNTREERTRVALETERHYLVEVATKAIPNFIAPFDYRKPVKNTEKLYVPAKDYPDINFMGLLLGPRGNTLKQLREQSGAILQIRGKGSVKDGKSVSSNDDEETNGAVAFSNPTLTSNADELHVLITADSQQKIAKAIKLTNEVIEKAISSPVGQNDLKRGQLRELAILNGTFRETKPYVPQEERQRPQIDISQIVCKICGNVGHFARDCKMGNNRNENNQNNYGNNSNNYSNNNNGNNNYNNNYNNYNNNYANSQNQNDYNKFPSSGAKHHLDGSVEDLPPWKKNKPNIPLPPWQNAPVQTASETLGSLPPPPTVSGFVPPVSHIPPPPSVRLPPPPINNTARAPPPPVGAKPVPSGAKPPPPPGSKPPPPDVKPPPPDVKPPPPPANRPPPPPTNT